ncbi:MAG: M56 family metallopeptidase [Candidatus Hydromicrobium sp.]|nr:M56 family metallopeptidase [Candidatus Hydromicrobium sp.]
MVFLEILTNYILPIIYDSFVSLVLVLFFLFIFRIKDSNIRILFFSLPLIKPFIVIAEKIDVNELTLGYKGFAGGIRFPDPLSFRPILELNKYELVNFSELNNLILLTALISISVILLSRWINIALFYRSLAYEEKVSRKEVPKLYSIIDNYIKKIKIKAPDISLTHRRYSTPFIVGIRTCTLVLSPTLIEKLNNEETETLIHHELSHIKRKDNLIGWIALILKDLNFFNPFAYISYYLIKDEQEKASDKLMIIHSDKSTKQVARNILSSILKINESFKKSFILESSPSHSSSFHFQTILNNKQIQSRVKNILKLNPDKINSQIFPKILMYILFLIILFIQIVLVMKFDNMIIFLR